MLAVENAQSRRANCLIEALDEREITLREFEDAAGLLKPEALQVAACVISGRTVMNPAHLNHLWSARAICNRVAGYNRNLC